MEDKKPKFNGYFRIFREIIYIISIVIVLVFTWANLSNAVENNSGNIQKHSYKIEKLEEFKEEVGGDIREIKTKLEYIIKELDKL